MKEIVEEHHELQVLILDGSGQVFPEKRAYEMLNKLQAQVEEKWTSPVVQNAISNSTEDGLTEDFRRTINYEASIQY